MILWLFKTCFTLLLISLIYIYLYFAKFFYYFYPDSNIVRRKFYSKYVSYINKILKISGIYNKIKFINLKSIDKNNWGLLILNHNSIIDNLIICILFDENNMTWNNQRTVSKKSSKKIQNEVLKIFDSLLVNKNLNEDIKNLKIIKNKWKQAKRPLQIILYPEGTIFSRKKLNEKQKKFLKDNNIKQFNNVLFPYTGIFNILIDKIKFKYIYEIRILYKLNKKRLIGEKNILTNLNNPNLEILVHFKKFNIKEVDKNWLFKRWEIIDHWINKNI